MTLIDSLFFVVHIYRAYKQNLPYTIQYTLLQLTTATNNIQVTVSFHPSAMSYTHPSHDEEAYDRTVRQSGGVGSYRLETPHFSCAGDSTQALFPGVSMGQNAGLLGSSSSSKKCQWKTNTDVGQLIDTDSDLMGITRKVTSKWCGPSQQPSDFKGLDVDLLAAPLADTPCGVNMFLTHEHTRMTASGPCTLRGTGINRFGFPLEDPQKAFEAREARAPPATSSRLLMKDNHRPCLRIPDPSLTSLTSSSSFVSTSSSSSSSSSGRRDNAQKTLESAYDLMSDLSPYMQRPSRELPTLAANPK